MVAAVENMAYFGETPWHGEGHRFLSPPTTEEEIVTAVPEIMLKVHKVPLYYGEGKPLEGHFGLVREDGAQFGTCRSQYEIMQSIDVLRFHLPIAEAGIADIETIGTLKGGAVVWCLAKIKDGRFDVANGDPVDQYFLLSSSHDGSMAVCNAMTPIRVVCMNTLGWALQSRNSMVMKARHTASAKSILDQTQKLILANKGNLDKTKEVFEAMAGKYVKKQELEDFVDTVLGIKDKDADDISARTANIREDIFQRFDFGIGQDNPHVRGTVWAAYNAVTEYLSYQAGRSSDSRLHSLWFGNNKSVNQKAFKEAVNLLAA